MRMARETGTAPIEITENGCSYGDAPDEDGMVRDDRRIAYYRGYLRELGRAIQDGVRRPRLSRLEPARQLRVGEGYAQRFGLVWVDFRHQRAHHQAVGALVRGRRRV